MLSRLSKIGGSLAAFAAFIMANTPAWADPVSIPAGSTETGGFMLSTQAIAVLSAAICIGLGSFAASLAQGNVIARVMEAIGRNPECSDKLQIYFYVGLGFIESLAIYTLVIAFMAISKVA